MANTVEETYGSGTGTGGTSGGTSGTSGTKTPTGILYPPSVKDDDVARPPDRPVPPAYYRPPPTTPDTERSQTIERARALVREHWWTLLLWLLGIIIGAIISYYTIKAISK